MQKHFAFCCVILSLLCVLAGCGGEPQIATDALAGLLSDSAFSPPPADLYFAAGGIGQTLDTVSLQLYGIPSEDLPPLSDYAILLGRREPLFEIHILRPQTLSERAYVEAILGERARAICLAVEDGHPVERAAVVVVRGQTVYLFATPYNRALAAQAKPL